MDSLEARVQRLEDVAEIVRLTSRYADAVNQGWEDRPADYGLLRQVFTEDARWTFEQQGHDARGIDDIETLLRQLNPAGSFAMHSFTNPVIDVDGDQATAHWLLWVAVGPQSPNEVFQSEDLEYVRTAVGWRIAALSLHFGQALLPMS